MTEKKTRHKRPLGKNTTIAVGIVQSSDEPVSTNQLVDFMNLDENSAMVLRRGLNRASERGDIRKLMRHKDGSYSWIGGELSVEKCAGHAANLFLDSQKYQRRVDPSKFATWLQKSGKSINREE